MSTDPAVAAANRVTFANEHADYGDAKAGAHEALAPIRDLHKRVPRIDGVTNFDLCDHCLNDMGIPEPWPCATALLAYPEEEL